MVESAKEDGRSKGARGWRRAPRGFFVRSLRIYIFSRAFKLTTSSRNKVLNIIKRFFISILCHLPSTAGAVTEVLQYLRLPSDETPRSPPTLLHPRFPISPFSNSDTGGFKFALDFSLLLISLCIWACTTQQSTNHKRCSVFLVDMPPTHDSIRLIWIFSGRIEVCPPLRSSPQTQSSFFKGCVRYHGSNNWGFWLTQNIRG